MEVDHNNVVRESGVYVVYTTDVCCQDCLPGQQTRTASQTFLASSTSIQPAGPPHLAAKASQVMPISGLIVYVVILAGSCMLKVIDSRRARPTTKLPTTEATMDIGPAQHIQVVPSNISLQVNYRAEDPSAWELNCWMDAS